MHIAVICCTLTFAINATALQFHDVQLLARRVINVRKASFILQSVPDDHEAITMPLIRKDERDPFDGILVEDIYAPETPQYDVIATSSAIAVAQTLLCFIIAAVVPVNILPSSLKSSGVILAFCAAIAATVSNWVWKEMSEEYSTSLRLLGWKTNISTAFLLSVYMGLLIGWTTETFDALLIQLALFLHAPPPVALLVIALSNVGLSSFFADKELSFTATARDTLLIIIFSAAYLLGDCNAAVPILGHALYSFLQLSASWIIIALSIYDRIDNAKRIRNQWMEGDLNRSGALPEQFDNFIRPVFDDLDLDSDGVIDKDEFQKFIARLGFDEIDYEFDAIDTNSDGRIEYDEFSAEYRRYLDDWLDRH